MPGRYIREGANASNRVNKLSPIEEVFYRRLLNVVDDYGLFDARIPLLRSELFPLRTDTVREADISHWLAACQKARLLLLYVVDGDPYGLALDTRWVARSKPKFPLPPNYVVDPENKCLQLCTNALSNDNGNDNGNDNNTPNTPPSAVSSKKGKFKPKIAFIIPGYEKEPIYGSFWQTVINACGKDQLQAGLIFYRARAAKPEKLIPWIIEGIRGKDGYAWKTCKEELDAPTGSVRAWIETTCFKMGAQKLGSIIAEALPQ